MHDNYARIEAEPTSAFDNQLGGPFTQGELLSVRQTAKRLGVSVRSIQRIQRERQLPYFKIRGCVRFLASEVHAYLEKQRMEADNIT